MPERAPLTWQDFERIREAFVDNPSIDEYVRLRREYPGVHLDIGVSEGVEFAF